MAAPLPLSMGAPGAGSPGASSPPVLPGSMAGSPPGPGASPVVSPGGGAGNGAAATAMMKAVMPAMHQALMAFPVGSKEYKAVLRALTSLTPIFGQAQERNLVPASLVQLAQAAKTGGPIASAPPPGLAPAPPPGGESEPPPMAA